MRVLALVACAVAAALPSASGGLRLPSCGTARHRARSLARAPLRPPARRAAPCPAGRCSTPLPERNGSSRATARARGACTQRRARYLLSRYGGGTGAPAWRPARSAGRRRVAVPLPAAAAAPHTGERMQSQRQTRGLAASAGAGSAKWPRRPRRGRPAVVAACERRRRRHSGGGALRYAARPARADPLPRLSSLLRRRVAVPGPYEQSCACECCDLLEHDAPRQGTSCPAVPCAAAAAAHQ